MAVKIQLKRLCGSPYNDKHCKNLYYSQEGEAVNNKKLDNYCLYCLSGKRPKKIADMASWTERTPKWCPKYNEEDN